MYVVYKITNTINKKIYIGSTTRPAARWLAHKQAANNQKYYLKYHLYAAMHFYGVEKFNFEIIENNFVNKETMEAREVELILEYNTTDPKVGYNLIAAAGYQLAKQNLCAHMMKVRQRCCKVDCNELILEQYESYQDAARKTGIDASVIRRVCKGNISSIKGMFFRDLDINDKIISLPFTPIKQRKPIVGISIHNGSKLYFKSILEASKTLSINRQSIQKCLAGDSRFSHTGGYIFRHVTKNNEIIENCLNINHILETASKLILIDDIYYTKKELCYKFNIKEATLNARIRNGNTGTELIRENHKKLKK